MKIYQVVKADYISGRYDITNFLDHKKAVEHFELEKQKMINQYNYYEFYDGYFANFMDPKNGIADFDHDNSVTYVSLSIDTNEIIK